jgi:hypothetical protein
LLQRAVFFKKRAKIYLKENMYKYTALRNKCRIFVHIKRIVWMTN